MSDTVPTVRVSPPPPPPSRKRRHDPSPEPPENGIETRDEADSPGDTIADSPGDTIADESEKELLYVPKPETDIYGKAKRQKQVHSSQGTAFKHEVKQLQLKTGQEKPTRYA
jgi:hypothetical protein